MASSVVAGRERWHSDVSESFYDYDIVHVLSYKILLAVESIHTAKMDSPKDESIEIVMSNSAWACTLKILYLTGTITALPQAAVSSSMNLLQDSSVDKYCEMR